MIDRSTIQSLIHKANCRYSGTGELKSCPLRFLQKKLRVIKDSLCTKCATFETLRRMMILYGHEAWTTLEEELHAQGIFKRREIRTIFSSVKENVV